MALITDPMHADTPADVLEALRPFAKAADRVADDPCRPDDERALIPVTVGDCRRLLRATAGADLRR